MDGNSTSPQIDDIKTEFHPHCGRETVIVSFAEYGQYKKSRPLPPRDDEPWRPFRKRIDFDFAEFAVQTGLTAHEVDAALALHRHSGVSGCEITIASHKEMYDLLDGAAVVLTSVSFLVIYIYIAKKAFQFQKSKIRVPYKNQMREHKLLFKDLFQCGLDLLHEPYLSPHFVWHAERTYKFNGQHFVRFIEEPWQANRWYDIEVSRKSLILLVANLYCSLDYHTMVSHSALFSIATSRSFHHSVRSKPIQSSCAAPTCPTTSLTGRK